MKRQRLNYSILQRWTNHRNFIVIYRKTVFFTPLPLSLLLTKAPLKTNLSRPENSATPLPPQLLARECGHGIFFQWLGRWCGSLLSVPLTAVLAVKDTIPHCWKEQFANHVTLESCVTVRYKEQKRKFQQIYFSYFLKGSQAILTLW